MFNNKFTNIEEMFNGDLTGDGIVGENFKDDLGLIIDLRDLETPFHIFTIKLNLKLCQDLTALVFHVSILPIK